MRYYRNRRYNSWRYRDWTPSKFTVLQNLLGSAVLDIKSLFLSFDTEVLEEVLSDYGAIYGDSAEKYAKKTFPKWKDNSTKLSGQTMERLVELVPPYLSPEQRFSLLKIVLKQNKPTITTKTIRINIKEPALGFDELKQALSLMTHVNILSNLPERVMKAAGWLYDDDITVARAMLAEVESLENDSIRLIAKKEIELLERTIRSGQIKAANYNVSMPAGNLSVIAFTPSKCFVATVCFGEEATETQLLRRWRDDVLLKNSQGIKFVVWYYNNGEKYSEIIDKHPIMKFFVKAIITSGCKILASNKLGTIYER